MTDLPPALPGVVDVRPPTAAPVPLVLDSPHSGALYPSDFAPLVGWAQYHRAADMDVDVLFGDAPAHGATLVAALFPRIWCDANRAPDDLDPATLEGDFGAPLNPSAKARLGKGLIWMQAPPEGAPLYPGPLPAAEARRRIDLAWTPYHATLAATLEAARARHGRVFHLDCHSMQAMSGPMHEEGPGKPRPDVVLSDRDGQTCAPAFIEAAQTNLQGLGFSVQINDPYKGAEIVRRYGRPAEGMHSLQIEISRALYMDEGTLARSDRFEDTRAQLAAFIARLAAETARIEG